MNPLTVIFVEPDGTEMTIEDVGVDLTLMEIAKANGIGGITGDCGGGCSCATCHVIVDDSWWDKVGPPDEVEETLLDMVSELHRPTSRLSCQIRMRDELDGIRLNVVSLS